MFVWLSDLIPTQNANMDKTECENEEVYRMQGLVPALDVIPPLILNGEKVLRRKSDKSYINE